MPGVVYVRVFVVVAGVLKVLGFGVGASLSNTSLIRLNFFSVSAKALPISFSIFFLSLSCKNSTSTVNFLPQANQKC